MQIRSDQIQALEQERLEAFIRRMSNMLNDKFPEWCASRRLDAAAREELVRGALDEARTYSIEGEADLELYIQCLAMLSPTFWNDPAYPWAHEILTRQDIEGTQKMDMIHDHLVFPGS